MTFHKLRSFLSGTLRGRLVLSVAVIHAIMMSLFVADLTTRQRAMLLENQTEASIATSNSLATSAAVWIAADDLSGLQELVETQRRYPEMSFVILTDENGRILAHSDKSKIGLYLLDLPEKPRQIVLVRSATLVDVAVPAMLDDRHVGWARVGLGQEAAAEKITGITNTGILYAIAAIFIGSVIAWNMGARITQRLYAVQDLIGRVKKGDRRARAIVTGADEATSIAHEFNSMLDALDEREEALRKSDARYRIVADNTQDWEFWLGNDGKFRYCSPSSLQLTGHSADEFLADSSLLYHIIHQKDRPLFEHHRQRSEQGHISEEIEFRIQHANGTIQWVSHLCHPLYDENGQFLGTRGANRNITDRKRAEDALRKNNALLERIFFSTEFLIAYLDPEFNFIRVNRAYAEADEHDPEFFIGKNHFDLYPNPENEEIFRRVVESGETFAAYAKPFEYPQNPEREITYWNWTLQPLKEADGHISGLVFSLVDVTARERAILAQHEADARYRTLIEQASDGIFVADPQGNYVDVNPSGCDMLGYTREEILKLNMRDLASAETQKEQPLRFNELRAGKTIISERTLVAKSGELLPVEISGRMLENGHFLGIVRNITERKRHEPEHQAIINVSAALRQVTTRTETLDVILKQLEELFETDGVVLVLPNPQDNGFVDEMGRGPVGEKMKGLVIPPGKGLCHWVITNKKPYINNHAEVDCTQ